MSTDDEEMMEYVVHEHDSMKSPWDRAKFLASFHVSHQLLSEFRQFLASRNSSTAQPTTPHVPPVRRKRSGSSRRPSSPRGTSGPRTPSPASSGMRAGAEPKRS